MRFFGVVCDLPHRNCSGKIRLALSCLLLLCVFHYILGCRFGSIAGGTAEALVLSNSLEADLGGGVKMYFAEIPTGSFQMGEVGTADPDHQVTISKALYMGQHEVTQAQYKQIMRTNPSYFIPTQTDYSSGYADTSSQPVEQVSWFDSVRFCNALSANQSLTPCYTNQSGNTTIADSDTITANLSANGYRLPTEAEWELACRGGTTSTYYWGSDSSEATIKQYAWYYMNAYDSYWTTPHADKGCTQPVGTKLPNSFGLYDMSGNVWEWCDDWYGGYSSSAQTDPSGPATGSYRVLRGGGWNYINGDLRSAGRSYFNPMYRYYNVGLRVCRSRP